MSYDAPIPGLLWLPLFDLICSSTLSLHRLTQAWFGMVTSSKIHVFNPSPSDPPVALVFLRLRGLRQLCCHCLVMIGFCSHFPVILLLIRFICRAQLSRWICFVGMNWVPSIICNNLLYLNLVSSENTKIRHDILLVVVHLVQSSLVEISLRRCIVVTVV